VAEGCSSASAVVTIRPIVIRQHRKHNSTKDLRE